MSQIFNRHSELELRRNLRHTMPPAEVILWKRLQRRQVADAKFRRQHSIEQFVVDFYCPEVRLAIELDGQSHSGEQAVERDAARQEFIESCGIAFLRFPNQDVYRNIESVVQNIEAKIRELRQKNPLRAEVVRSTFED